MVAVIHIFEKPILIAALFYTTVEHRLLTPVSDQRLLQSGISFPLKTTYMVVTLMLVDSFVDILTLKVTFYIAGVVVVLEPAYCLIVTIGLRKAPCL